MESRIIRLEERVGYLETLFVQVMAHRPKTSSPGDYQPSPCLSEITNEALAIDSLDIHSSKRNQPKLHPPRVSGKDTSITRSLHDAHSIGATGQTYVVTRAMQQHDELDDIYFEF